MMTFMIALIRRIKISGNFNIEPQEGRPFAGHITPKDDIQPYDYIPQPYLCAYMRELLKALGYELEYNAIEDTPWKSMYLVHVINTYKWNEMCQDGRLRSFSKM